jgi:hypothetical protein
VLPSIIFDSGIENLAATSGGVLASTQSSRVRATPVAIVRYSSAASLTSSG